MPSPNDARKASAKKMPEKTVDLGQKLARKRSQDFASKIQGWNQAGGGVSQQHEEVVVVEDSDSVEAAQTDAKQDNTAQIVVETESLVPDPKSVTYQEANNVSPRTPSTPGTPGRITPKTSAAKKAGRDINLTRGAWVRRKSKPQAEAAEITNAGTPKKRIVSDGHWRRDRLPKEETPVKENEDTPKPVIIRKSVVKVGMAIPPSHQDFSESDPEPEPVRVQPLRHAYSRSPSGTFDRREATPDYETSGTKVYIKRRRHSRVLDEEIKTMKDAQKSESSFIAPSSVDRPSSGTDITTPSMTPLKESMERPASAPRPGIKAAQVKVATNRPKSAGHSLEPGNAQRFSSAGLERTNHAMRHEEKKLKPSKSAEAYAKNVTEPIRKPSAPITTLESPRVYGSRIEGWLANMPDPFTDARRPSLTPEPLEISKRSTKKSDGERDLEDVNDHRRASGRRRSSRHDQDRRDGEERYISRTFNDLDDTSPAAPTSLKRRGARRGSLSPVKGRDSRESTPTNFDALMSGALPNLSSNSSRKLSATTEAKKFRIPSGGRPLSAIPSVDILQPPHSHHQTPERAILQEGLPSADASVLSRASDGDGPVRNRTGLQQSITKYSNPNPTLSMAKDDSHVLASARSLRASQRRSEVATLGEVMNELSIDELKYQRELRTLVDGVIPVLLQHALSGPTIKPDSRIFSRPSGDTKPIVDMGVALERLKNSHKWVPLHEPGELLTWADGAAKVYGDYIKTWRLGFKDIIVNLAPAEQAAKRSGSPGWGDGLPRNKEGDLVDGSGERVDVAYLLKRPLVRLKYLTKTFENIHRLQPSPKAEDIAGIYDDLIVQAKGRVNDEQARLEDEAASSIDPTRARDPRSLAPITGVTVDPTRSVRARDYFDMDLTHSSGQQLGCKIEIIYRDDAPGRGRAGDILFCEISAAGRWLLFPPLPTSLVTARKGGRAGELVVMIRGFLPNAQQWREVMALQTDYDRTSLDWVSMLGSSPMPPKLSKKSSFNMLNETRLLTSDIVAPSGTLSPTLQTSLREIEVPIGEKAKSTSRIWDGSDVNSVCEDDRFDPLHKEKPKRYRSTTSPSNVHQQRRGWDAAQPAYFHDSSEHNRTLEQAIRRPPSKHTRSKSEWTAPSVTSSSKEYSVWMPSTDSRLSDDSSGDENHRVLREPSVRPGMRRRTSSVPSLDMPMIPKLRKSSQPQQKPTRSQSPSSDRDQLPSQKRMAAGKTAQTPLSAPSKLQKHRLSTMEQRVQDKETDPPPATPSHSRPLSFGLKSNILPSLTPTFLKKKSRPSSPLKHEYEPSTASDSLSDSDLSDLSESDSQTSQSIVEGTIEEVISTVGDLKAFQEYAMRGIRRSSPPPSQPTLPETSLAPSESASQAPYRTVPPPVAAPAKTVATIFSWSDRGSWDTLHPEECQIFVTPGLIEAFDLTQANSVDLDAEGERSTPSSKGVKPLVALELTPLVPLRRGTAVDISIRSPPTSNSLIRTGNNIMFRSRSPEECEKLYALINRARIDNPTYIALQHARGPVQQSNWGEVMDRRNAARTSSGGSRSWWNLGSRKSGSYRSKGSRTLSIAATESSVGTMNSAFSALRRFSGGSRIFNIAKSTITSREGTRSSNSESLSSGVGTPLPFDPRLGTPLGITSTKIRLYVRDIPSKWRDLGAARLTIMLPPRQDPTAAAKPGMTSLEKRILVYGKSNGETLLDVTLGESAFERIARTGIAVSVYEEADHVGAEGGVLVARTKVYMIQMKSERDAAYTFGLVGKLRY